MRVSDQELLSRIESLARNEHEMTVEVLLHLNEVEERRLHLTLGYGTMFDFAVRYLCYSASAAGRRIQVARCIRRHPELLEPLREREINLSTIGLIAGVLDEGNLKELIDAIRGKSQREVEHVAARYRPVVEIRDRVQPVRVGRKANRPPDPAATSLFSVAPAGCSNGIGPRDRDDTRSQVSHSRAGVAHLRRGAVPVLKKLRRSSSSRSSSSRCSSRPGRHSSASWKRHARFSRAALRGPVWRT
jgi:hypothetical protein